MFNRSISINYWFTLWFFAILSLVSERVEADTKLIMVEQEGCHYCEKWLAEIGDRYHLTDEGRIAPLRRVFIEDTLPSDLPPEMASISITPTFVLVKDGLEVDRLYGYAGDQFFWGQLQEMLNKLPDHLVVAE